MSIKKIIMWLLLLSATIAVLSLLIITLHLFSVKFITEGLINDPPNLSTLLVEILIGITLALLLYGMGSIQQNKIKGLLTQLQEQQNQVSKIISDVKNLEENQKEKYAEKEEIENRFYKIDLLANLISELFVIRQSLWEQLFLKNKHTDEKEFYKRINDLKDNFGYWSDRITTLNSNTYVPPDIRNAVRMFTHQAIKSIDSADMPLRYDFLEKTVFTYVDFIIDSEYVKNDMDNSIQKFREDIMKSKQDIFDFRKDYQERFVQN